MSKRAVLLLVLALATSTCLIFPVLSQTQYGTIIVPDRYPTITAAINSAADGATILVRRETYEEYSLIINKSLTLVGEDANSTIIKNIGNPPVQSNSRMRFVKSLDLNSMFQLKN